jgi:peptide alpha-N-acetyltransferase
VAQVLHIFSLTYILTDLPVLKIALETEITNTAAIKLYERLGFLRSKRLHRYYLNGNSAYRLVLYLKEGVSAIPAMLDPYDNLNAPLFPENGDHSSSYIC